MNYKNGRIKRSGYWYIKLWGHPYSGKQGYVAEHRLVMEKHLERYLRPEETVHHIDGNKTNNNISNLQLFHTRGEHTKIAHEEVSINNKQRNKGKHLSPKTEFKKGIIPWNKGTKGITKAWNKGLIGFQKGHRPYNTKPNKTSFKKGMIPWNKGLKKIAE